MALNDIRPYRSVRGGTETHRAFPITSTAAFVKGEPVRLTAGRLLEASDDPASVVGIAAEPAQDVFGAFRGEGTLISAVPTVDTQQFICANFATDGAGTLATPTIANASGQFAGLTLTGGGAWVVDTGTANLILQIDQVLDADRQDIDDPNVLPTAGVAVVFHFV